MPRNRSWQCYKVSCRIIGHHSISQRLLKRGFPIKFRYFATIQTQKMAASNKECLVIVIDVREGTNKKFKESAIKYAGEILKDKICADKKDMITFLLMGTKRSNNSLHSKTVEGYCNIVEHSEVQAPTWRLFCNFIKSVHEEEPGTQADWLDALIVALEIQNENQENFKFPHRRIILFHDFDGSTKDFDEFNVIANSFVEKDISLIVVSSRIAYTTNPKTFEPQAVFLQQDHKTDDQKKDESFALRLVSDCNAKLCNFDEGLRTSIKLSNKRPWTWNGHLVIGSQIKIAISGVIAIKDDNNIKLKKCWGTEEEVAKRELRTFVRGVEMEPLDIDMINGYMLGATPIPFDETLEEAEDERTVYQTGLKFLGFPKLNSIPEEYYNGDSLYWIVHRRGMTESAKKLDALVQALHNAGRAMLCWKIYSPKYNTPKLVVLLPNEMHQDRPASLSMIELTYHAQHHYWDFPTLCTDKTKCSKQQLDAIDDLIDSMDLMLDMDDKPRQTYENEILAFNSLPHIFEKNMMDILERKVICNAGEDDEQFQKMLADKNFVEIFWKVPEKVEEGAKRAAKKVRELFPLERNVEPLKNKADPGLEKNNGSSSTKAVETAGEPLGIESVGLKTPDDDFEKLLKHNVISVKDNTIRDKKFHFYARQIRTVLWSLIFETSFIELDKIADTLFVYRKCCFDFNAFMDYNEWISDVRAAIMARKELHKLWHHVIVPKGLGLCFIGQPTIEELMKMEDFYKLNITDSGIGAQMSEDAEMPNASADDSFNASK